MTKLIPPANPGWPDVTRFEVVERLLGGDGGALNRAPLELLERTEFLKKQIDVTITSALALKAPLASPSLTGMPTAPTALLGTNTTQLANTEFVQAAIAALVASSPAALDTLKELAAALGNDANFATTMTNALALKAPLASPALTGTPTAPTAAANTNTTQLATTAFVQQEIAGDLATAAPQMDGVAAVGTSTKLARENHVHPTDTSRAPLASPALTGTPTAPTAAAGTNTTQLANTAFVQAAIAALVASSPAALDTLNELAAALGNDANFATTMTNALALKAPLASPALTGSPTAPTAVAGNRTQQLANMDAVHTAIGAGQIAFFAQSTAPAGYLKANGAAISRTTYASLFNAITIQTTGNTTNGSTSVTAVASTTGLANGMPISGPGIPAGATVTAFTVNTITLSANATATTNGVALVVAPFGVGDGATTFNVPDLRGEFIRGFDDARGVDSSRVFGSNQISTQIVVDDDGNQVVGAIDWTNNNLASLGYETAQISGVNIHFVNSTTTSFANSSAFLRSIRPRNVAFLACIKF